MSKYIRNKMFQILEVIRKEKDTHFKDVTYWYKCKGCGYKIHSDFVIKESDNLEDLLDEYVVDCEHKDSIKNHFIYTLPKNIKTYYLGLNQDIKDATIIYGAIWTNQGLTYVAELNEKGEWKLI